MALQLHKTCKSCGITKPLINEYWASCKGCSDGYRGKCKSCINKDRQGYRKNSLVVYTLESESNHNELRPCSRCKVFYPKTNKYFYFSTSRGFYSQCISCRKAYRPEDYQRRQSRRKADYEYKEKCYASAMASYWKYRDRYLEKNRLYTSRPEFIELNRKRSRQWQINNPEQVKANIQRRRSRLASADGFFADIDIFRILKAQEYKCLYCGCDVSKKYTIDHLTPLSRGGSNWPFNIGIACRRCNSKKGAKTKDEYLTLIGVLKYG